MSSRATSSRSCRRVLAACAVLAATLLAACDSGSPSPPRRTRRTRCRPRLTLGVYGADEEVAAPHRRRVDVFNGTYRRRRGRSSQTWTHRETLIAAMEAERGRPRRVPGLPRRPRLAPGAGADPAGRRRCSTSAASTSATTTRATRSQAFSADDRLQCMPYGISPMVIFYNNDLVDFDRMEAARPRRARPTRTGAQLDLRPVRRGGRLRDPARAGAPRASTSSRRCEALAPFIYSGGGQVFDDDDDPTSLAFSDGDTRDALERTLELLRDPHADPERGAARRSAPPLEWFERGKLGDDRRLPRRWSPSCGRSQGLDFDVIADAGPRRGRHGRGHHRPVPVGRRRRTPRRPPTSWSTCSSTPAGGARGPDGLPRAGQPRGRPVRRLPPAGPAARDLRRVQRAASATIVVPPLLSTWPELEAAVASQPRRAAHPADPRTTSTLDSRRSTR